MATYDGKSNFQLLDCVQKILEECFGDAPKPSHTHRQQRMTKELNTGHDLP